jgi:formimidoylglutamate deiminase
MKRAAHAGTVLERSSDGTLRLPALTSAHSHAFQRAMRGRAQRPSRRSAGEPAGEPNGRDDFWSWRREMYALASSVTPESIHEASLVAFRELARAGVRTVGEFHYLHYQPDGTPYGDRTILADVVIEAARQEGLRIALLRVAYQKAGEGRTSTGSAQRRFSDRSVDDVLRDVDALRAKWKSDRHVVIGVAPHSVRAVPGEWLAPLAEHAARTAIPIHMHVAEQEREVEQCLAQSGRRPVELLADRGVLCDRFVAVHATHLARHEARLLGEARAFACICATTERDLGDGLPDVGALRSAGVRLCTGVDSYVVVEPIEDLRALETHERLRTKTRVTFRPVRGTPAEQLWREGSLEGARACGFTDAGGRLVVRRDHPALALVDDEYLLDAIVFGAGASVVERVENSKN